MSWRGANIIVGSPADINFVFIAQPTGLTILSSFFSSTSLLCLRYSVALSLRMCMCVTAKWRHSSPSFLFCYLLIFFSVFLIERWLDWHAVCFLWLTCCPLIFDSWPWRKNKGQQVQEQISPVSLLFLTLLSVVYSLILMMRFWQWTSSGCHSIWYFWLEP